MSCRNTAGGSLATTFAVTACGLTDGQATSLFHRSMRASEADAGFLALPAQDRERAYSRSLDALERDIIASPDFDSASGTKRNRALARVRAARAAGYPGDARAWALINMKNLAIRSRIAIETACEMPAAARGISRDEMVNQFQAEARNRHSDITPAEDVPAFLPQDPGTRRAWASLFPESGARSTGNETCPQCHQFIPRAGNHTCPTRQTPVAPTDVDPPSAANPASDGLFVTRTELGWSEDIDAFQSVYDKAKQDIADGDTRVPTFPDLESTPGGVTGMLGEPELGMTFGLEIEIDFPDEPWEERGSRREMLARRLHEEGLSDYDYVSRWHTIGNEGLGRPGGTYQMRPDGWICEFDRSVDDEDGERGVEIKSQILYDEPATWSNLRKICEIAEELGGKATPRTGLHVNVDGSLFPNNDPSMHARLLGLAGEFDDTIIRMAHNPESAPTHRGRRHCAPNPAPPRGGFRDVRTARNYGDHYSAVNFSHLPDEYAERRSSSRVEMRMFDSTLDPGRIQAQVALSLGLVAAAATGEEPGEREVAGSHRGRFGGRRLEGEEWAESTRSFRRLIDVMGRVGLGSPEHVRQFTHLFAATRWQNG